MLTPRQQRFVEEYRVDGDADGGRQAAIRAGYSEKTAAKHAQQNLTKPGVMEALKGAEAQKQISQQMPDQAQQVQMAQKVNESVRGKSIISAEYVVQSLMDTLERCLQAKPVLDRSGKPVYVDTPEGTLAAAYTFDAQHALKASELLGKHLGLFVDRSEKKDGKEGGAQAATPVINLTLNKSFDP